MALSGPAPKDFVRHRVKTHGYEEIPNVPNTRMPRLPDNFKNKLGPDGRHWLVVAARCPQAAYWTAVDWQYCWESALVAEAFYANPGNTSRARELARREADLGLTPSGRKAARIRYVDPQEEEDDGYMSEDEIEAALNEGESKKPISLEERLRLV